MSESNERLSPSNSETPIIIFLIVNIWFVIFCNFIINHKRAVPKLLYLSCVSTLTVSLLQFWRLFIPEVRKRLHRFRPTAIEFVIQMVWLFILSIWTISTGNDLVKNISYCSMGISLIITGVIIKKTFFVTKYVLYFEWLGSFDHNKSDYREKILQEIKSMTEVEVRSNNMPPGWWLLYGPHVKFPWQNSTLLSYVIWDGDYPSGREKRLDTLDLLYETTESLTGNSVRKMAFLDTINAPFKNMVHIIDDWVEPGIMLSDMLALYRDHAEYVEFKQTNIADGIGTVKKWIRDPEGLHNLD